MIEIGIFDTGSTDLPFKKTANGVHVTDAAFPEIQEAAKRLTVEQIRRTVLAEELGYDLYWNSEHHFNFEGTELSPNPIQTQTAVAALTKKIRLGQMANILTWHHPVRFAEQLAILDIISGGRVECGIGRGYQSRETETFGATYGSSTQDQERNRSYYEEVIEIILKCWTEESFSYTGEFFNLPPSWAKWNHPQDIAYYESQGLNVEDYLRLGEADSYSSGPVISNTTTTVKQLSCLPQPLQTPYPPMWEPVNSSRSVEYAARQGFNANFFLETTDALKVKVDAYMKASEEAGWPDPVAPGTEFKCGWDSARHRGVAAGRLIHIEDGEIGNVKKAGETQMYAWDWTKAFGFTVILADPGEAPDPNMTVTPELLREKGINLHGSKDQVIEGLLAMRDKVYAESDFIINCWFESSCETHGETEEQMQYFAEEVMPVLEQECGGRVQRPELGVDLRPKRAAGVVS
jgi:alkanesulfonate monooxygenase SsuD/methylene tetrahydromethanopterin reductase-like flavin-dependent oxidoreductase (luciferase family)